MKTPISQRTKKNNLKAHSIHWLANQQFYETKKKKNKTPNISERGSEMKV